MFDHDFPKQYEITEVMVAQARDAAKKYQNMWDFKKFDFQEGMVKIFGRPFPDSIPVYINSSPYSMDKYPDYISISMQRDNPLASICHEASHFMLRKYFPNVGNFEEVKEILTVINYDVFDVKDIGWKTHKEIRSRTYKKWTETKDLQKTINYIETELVKSMKN